MPDGEKVSAVSKRFGVNPQTVRQWADHFAPFLSEGANPPTGDTRYFNSNDLQVLALVAYMRGKDAPLDEIRTALQSGQRGLMMDLAQSGGLPSDPAEAIISGVSAGGYLARVEDLAQNLGYVRGELSRVEVELRGEREAHDVTRQREAELRERAAMAEERARLLQSPAPVVVPPTDPSSVMVWRWVLVAALVAIVALLAAVAWQGVTP